MESARKACELTDWKEADCLAALAAAHAGAAGGADRIELAPDLTVGGLTPSHDLTSRVLDAIDLPVFAMVRPRAGDFIYSGSEIAAMCNAIERLHALGVHGVVTGALTDSREIDLAATAALVSAAAGMPFTFHRAFDRAVDQSAALEQLAELYVQQGVMSEARPIYLQLAEAHLKASRSKQAVEVLLVAVDASRAQEADEVEGVAAVDRRTRLRRTRVVCVVGSFGKTTTRRAISAALGVPAHGVCTLDVLAAVAPADVDGPFLVATDARRNSPECRPIGRRVKVRADSAAERLLTPIAASEATVLGCRSFEPDRPFEDRSVEFLVEEERRRPRAKVLVPRAGSPGRRQ